MAGKRNPAISLCRVFSMVLIVLCHIIAHYSFIPGHRQLPQILNVGVYTFLGISGFLYGGKTISRWGRWMGQRLAKIILPALLLSAAVLSVGFLLGERYDTLSVVFNLFQLQGLAFVLPRAGSWFSGHSLSGPLWFLTIIMLCYCMTPLFQCLRDSGKMKNAGNWAAIAAVGCFALGVTTQINLFYFLTFAMGYHLGAKQIQLRTRSMVLPTLVMVAAQFLRLQIRICADGTPLYQTFTYLSHMILGLWMLCAFLWCEKRFPAPMTALAERKAMYVFDEFSLYVYMVHGMFSAGRLSPYEFSGNLLLATVLFILFTAVGAWVLQRSTKLAATALVK